MVQESGSDTFCIAEKLKPRSAIKGTLRGVRGGVKSPYSICGPIPGAAAFPHERRTAEVGVVSRLANVGTLPNVGTDP